MVSTLTSAGTEAVPGWQFVPTDRTPDPSTMRAAVACGALAHPSTSASASAPSSLSARARREVHGWFIGFGSIIPEGVPGGRWG